MYPVHSEHGFILRWDFIIRRPLINTPAQIKHLILCMCNVMFTYTITHEHIIYNVKLSFLSWFHHNSRSYVYNKCTREVIE